jgi:hypothetical protein
MVSNEQPIDYGDRNGAMTTVQPLPNGVILSAAEITRELHLVQATLRGIMTRLDRVEQPKPKKRTGPRPKGVPPNALTAAQQTSWRHYHWALTKEPSLVGSTDVRVYDWLASCADFHGELPRAHSTWTRNLRACRLFHGVSKRGGAIGRPREPAPGVPSGSQERLDVR